MDLLLFIMTHRELVSSLIILSFGFSLKSFFFSLMRCKSLSSKVLKNLNISINLQKM